MPSVKLGLVCLGFLIGSDGRIHRRFSERHGLSRLDLDKLVPNPSDTSVKLDQVEQNVNNWPPARTAPDVSIAGVSASASIDVNATASTPETSSIEANIGTVTDLQQALKEIQGQSNTGIAQLSGSTAMNTMVIDVLKSDVKKFQQQVERNFSRIDGLLNELGGSATSGGLDSLSNTVNQIQAELSAVTSGGSIASVIQGTNQRIGDLGSAVTTLDQRVAGLEKQSGGNQAQSAESADNTLSSAASISFLLSSWTGRVALGGAAFGLVALILSIVALTGMPKKEEVKSLEASSEEQVLMEAGEAAENAEGAEYYEEEVVEEQAQ